MTYVVNSVFDYFLQTAAGATVIFKSKNGGQVRLTKNIWGPGNITFSCDVSMEADIGVAPAQGALTAQSYQYVPMDVTEEI